VALLRIRNAAAIGPTRLRLVLSDGSIVERDVAALLSGPVFAALRQDRGAFSRVHVEAGTVAWDSGADLCPDVVIWGGAPPPSPTARPPRDLVVPRPPDR
jgi:hypothetical protein